MVKLIEVGNESARDSLVTAAKNIRLQLADRFPGVRFAVKTKRYSGGDSINVAWTAVMRDQDARFDRLFGGCGSGDRSKQSAVERSSERAVRAKL